MSEAVSFWLDNKNCAGTKSAVSGEQVLVLYRDRYYVVKGGVAQTRGGRPLRFSTSSLPSAWKRAMRGESPAPVASPTAIDTMTTTRPPKCERKKAGKPTMPESKQETAPESGKAPLTSAPKKATTKTASHPPVVANCPYCKARHEIPVDKGKSGKPFFITCGKCKSEFGVRFVQVTTYQAQVAGFR